MLFHRFILGMGVCSMGLMIVASALAQSKQRFDSDSPVPIEDRINRPKPKPAKPMTPVKPVKPAKPAKPAEVVNEIIQEFPTNEVMQTAWKIHWGQKSGNGLYLHGAWFKRSPKDDWMQIVGDV